MDPAFPVPTVTAYHPTWWALLLRGLAAILLAIVTFALPGITIAFLVTLFGIYALIDGVLAIISTIRAVQGHRRWGSFLLEGVVSLLIGLYAVIAPLAGAAIFVTILAIWALITGGLEIAAAIRLRRHIQGEWLLILTGIVSILFGILLFAEPISGAVVLVWFLAGYALVFGILLVLLAFRVRRAPISALPAS
ncbi:MAG TPA: HdeD family acid-resistance protein [Bryobacteraceae bacterium]|nr:HdeD family acid-resistance protein [Bryobacteraceae bacterium]